MRLKFLAVLIVGTAILQAGCTQFQQTLTASEQAFSPTQPQSIDLFFSNESPKHAYKEIGYIVADKGSSKEAVDFLKEKAAGMGADALVNCEVHVYHYLAMLIVFIPIFDDAYIASGVPVKYSQSPAQGERQ